MLFASLLSGWGYGLAPFQMGIWTGPFLVGDTDWLLSRWGYGSALFWLGKAPQQGKAPQKGCLPGARPARYFCINYPDLNPGVILPSRSPPS